MPSVPTTNPARLSVVTRDFTTSPTLGALLAMLNPYLANFQIVIKFVVIIVKGHPVGVLSHKLNEDRLFVVGVRVCVHNVAGTIDRPVFPDKHNNIATPQIINLTLRSHT
jgi:hypothetical protein